MVRSALAFQRLSVLFLIGIDVLPTLCPDCCYRSTVDQDDNDVSTSSLTLKCGCQLL